MRMQRRRMKRLKAMMLIAKIAVIVVSLILCFSEQFYLLRFAGLWTLVFMFLACVTENNKDCCDSKEKA